MFTQRERRDLREYLVAAARVDERISAAAVVGSAAAHREDEWSDIDLAFRLAAGLEPADIGDAWTGRMYEDHGAVDHLDVWSERTLFRVFLLSSSMQVDLSFRPWETFAASGASFRLLFGEANKPRSSSSPTPETLIGMGWLYALHARASIARDRNLQARGKRRAVLRRLTQVWAAAAGTRHRSRARVCRRASRLHIRERAARDR